MRRTSYSLYMIAEFLLACSQCEVRTGCHLLDVQCVVRQFKRRRLKSSSAMIASIAMTRTPANVAALACFACERFLVLGYAQVVKHRPKSPPYRRLKSHPFARRSRREIESRLFRKRNVFSKCHSRKQSILLAKSRLAGCHSCTLQTARDDVQAGESAGDGGPTRRQTV